MTYREAFITCVKYIDIIHNDTVLRQANLGGVTLELYNIQLELIGDRDDYTQSIKHELSNLLHRVDVFIQLTNSDLDLFYIENRLRNINCRLIEIKEKYNLKLTYPLFFLLMNKDEKDLLNIVKSKHNILIKQLEEKFGGTKKKAINTYENMRSWVLNLLYTNVYRLAEFNRDYNTEYSPLLAMSIVRLLLYDLNNYNMMQYMEESMLEIEREFEGTGHSFKEEGKVKTIIEAQKKFYWTAESILLALRFVGDGDINHWPNVNPLDDVINSLSDFKFNKRKLQKMQLLNENNYKGLEISKALEVELLRRAVIKCKYSES